MKKIKIAVFVVILILLDQIIKLFITGTDAVNANITLVPGILMFHPLQNTSLSWFGSMGIPFMSGYAFNLILPAIILFFSMRGPAYIMWRFPRGVSKFIMAANILLTAGAACSFIDTLFWGGSWDYIKIQGFFTFDLKDCYISFFVVSVIFMTIRYYKEFSELSNEFMWKEIRNFIRFAMTGKKTVTNHS